ncbi:MAG TPA: diguanylate cyclase [Methylophaga sp.]|nr:diguanylate cyclase [Methylophaga sp.]
MRHTINSINVDWPLKSIIGIALVYFLLALLSAQVSSLTGITQLLSLNSGFALAVMLAMPHQKPLLGIALGAFLLTIYRVFVLNNGELSPYFIVPVFLVVIQLYLDFKIYRKWLSGNNNLSHSDDLFLFLKVIPLIALVNASFSVMNAQWLDSVEHGIFTSVWIKIWIGHTAGLILIVPFVLSLVERSDPLWAGRQKILAFIFIMSLAITFILCANIRFYENNRLEERFQILTNQTSTLFQASLKEKEILQASVVQLLVSSEYVTRSEFKQFVEGLSIQTEYIQVIEWLPKINADQRLEYEKDQESDYGKGFVITEAKAGGVLVPATKREVYYPITYLEPDSDNDLAKGFDPSGSAAVRAIMKKAAISGESQARGPVEIIRSSGFKHAFIVYKPVYENILGTKSLNPSQGDLSGFVSVVVKVEDFVATIVGPAETANFNLQWQDTESGRYYFNNKVGDYAPFKHVVDINLSGRMMKLIFTPTDAFIAQSASDETTIAMLTGLGLASLFSMLMLTITALTSRIQCEVKLRTSELEDLNKKLELLSNKDVLTELFNRRYFENALQDEFERSLRYKNAFALIMFDIDNFKKINDEYGHPCGDEVIKSIANYLISTRRSTDILARIGGEEFALILPAQSTIHIMSIVERIRTDISKIEVKDGEQTIKFTCSFGIAIFNEYLKDTHTLIKMADQAMYKAKAAGRNRTELFS